MRTSQCSFPVGATRVATDRHGRHAAPGAGDRRRGLWTTRDRPQRRPHRPPGEPQRVSGAGHTAAMRTDLTIRTRDGVDHDLAVIAPAGTTLVRARAALEAAVANPVPGWAGVRRLDNTAVFGRPPLVHGAVLACSPAPADRPAA